MSLENGLHLWNCYHHNLCHEHIHHLQKFLPASLLSFLVITLNIRSTPSWQILKYTIVLLTMGTMLYGRLLGLLYNGNALGFLECRCFRLSSDKYSFRCVWPCIGYGVPITCAREPLGTRSTWWGRRQHVRQSAFLCKKSWYTSIFSALFA